MYTFCDSNNIGDPVIAAAKQMMDAILSSDICDTLDELPDGQARAIRLVINELIQIEKAIPKG